MRVIVDSDRCQGHGRCYTTAPELFAPDELGDSEVIGDGTVPAGLENRARLTAVNCPESAITVEED